MDVSEFCIVNRDVGMKGKQRLSKVWYRASKSHHVGALAFLVDSTISMLWYWQITLARS